jgi:hypothetical protein
VIEFTEEVLCSHGSTSFRSSRLRRNFRRLH